MDAIEAAAVVDALERGQLPAAARWLEIGSGTGAGARVVSDHAGSLVCLDLSEQMLRNAPDISPRVRADASRLPIADGSVDVVLMINVLLFPDEVDRVLARDGQVVWVNTLGDRTPIHLPPFDVLDALPGPWVARTARAGTGFWVTARRA
ncbi:class I SAM-dependent methyltransferase [Ilumatobacter sp.]|uniref:class I SAM-dependent methyltransferase n=1 Tax=Ilumatobacter sp. TaxID=1967498 RepID=UPI003B523A4F